MSNPDSAELNYSAELNLNRDSAQEFDERGILCDPQADRLSLAELVDRIIDDQRAKTDSDQRPTAKVSWSTNEMN